MKFSRFSILLLLVCVAIALGAGLLLSSRSLRMSAMVLAPSNSKYPDHIQIKPEDVKSLLRKSSIEPLSDTGDFVEEPPLPPGHEFPGDSHKLGVGTSYFLVDTKWATVRYVGQKPAGAGLTGEALNKAQIDAFGTANDSTPVVTAATTINDMMENYFVPLIQSLPGMAHILDAIKVQGAYYAPGFRSTDGSQVGRDNAYVIGLQSLHIYPNSCFDNPRDTSCAQPFFSTGHDPTVMGHELGHVIFNHLRRQKALDGFQWFSVNEGYADYFSASYFSEPVLGRIWRVTRASNPYLRRLLDSPKALEEVQSQDAHRFSVVWSSALWRARETLSKRFKVTPKEIDRAVLLSIVFLGETQKTRLGDAATAVLKACEFLGHGDWKAVYRDEFKRAAIDFAAMDNVRLIREGDDIPPDEDVSQPAGAQCGVVGSKPSQGGSSFFLILPLILVPLLNRRARLLAACALAFASSASCIFQDKRATAKPPGQALAFSCYLDAIDGDSTPSSSGSTKMQRVFLTAVHHSDIAAQILVSDERFERSEAAVIFIVDRQSKRIDQVRNRDGKPFESSLVPTDVTLDVAKAYKHIKVGTFLLDHAVQAIAAAKEGAGAQGGVGFIFENRKFFASRESAASSEFPYGPIPKYVDRNGQNICRYDGEVSN